MTPDPNSPEADPAEAAATATEQAQAGKLAPLARIEEFLAAAMMLSILVAVALQIFTRYVMRSPLIWTDEVARFGVVWLTFLAAAFVTAYGRQITVEFMDKYLGERRIRMLRIFARTVVVLVCGLMIVGSVVPVEFAARRLSTALRVPLSFLLLSAPVGFGLIGLHSLWSLIRLLRGEKLVDTTGSSI